MEYRHVVLYFICGLLVYLIAFLRKQELVKKVGYRGIAYTVVLWPIGLLLMLGSFLGGLFRRKK